MTVCRLPFAVRRFAGAGAGVQTRGDPPPPRFTRLAACARHPLLAGQRPGNRVRPPRGERTARPLLDVPLSLPASRQPGASRCAPRAGAAPSRCRCWRASALATRSVPRAGDATRGPSSTSLLACQLAGNKGPRGALPARAPHLLDVPPSRASFLARHSHNNPLCPSFSNLVMPRVTSAPGPPHSLSLPV